MPRPEKIRLGELLVQQNLLTAEQLKAALDEQKRSGRRLGRVLVEGGMLSEEQISTALARQLQIPYINLKYYTVKSEIVTKLSEAHARRFRAIVLDEINGVLQVAMVDPTDIQTYDEITRILKRDITLAVVTESLLLQTIDRLYRRTEEISGLVQELGAEMGEVAIDLGLTSAPGVEDAPVVKLLQSIFEDASQIRASDIHIEPLETKLQIRFRIDGVLHIQAEADIKIATALALRLKLMSGLDIAEKRLPQDGRFNVKVRQNQIDVRISTLPTQYGESVVMRLLNQSTGLLGLDRLGLTPRIMERVRTVISRVNGMVLTTGPTGSGKTTTLYAALAEINSPNKKIITVEDPVEYRLPGINQVQVHEKIELTFDRVLRSALRQDPDVILVGEIRDQLTAEIGMRASMTGHMVLSTLHTNDAVSTPIRLLDMGVPRYMVALSLQLILAQRLVRLICESCAEPHKLLPYEHQWLKSLQGIETDDHKYMVGRGCSVCNGTGYYGRCGVYEMLEMTQPLIEAIHEGDAVLFSRKAREQIGNNNLQGEALRLVLEGKTTVQEAMKLSNQIDE